MLLKDIMLFKSNHCKVEIKHDNSALFLGQNRNSNSTLILINNRFNYIYASWILKLPLYPIESCCAAATLPFKIFSFPRLLSCLCFSSSSSSSSSSSRFLRQPCQGFRNCKSLFLILKIFQMGDGGNELYLHHLSAYGHESGQRFDLPCRCPTSNVTRSFNFDFL